MRSRSRCLALPATSPCFASWQHPQGLLCPFSFVRSGLIAMATFNLRSDTVTRPVGEVLAAMAAAEVGDDAHGDCPTTKRLEAHAAALTGKEAAAFVCSGVMGNLTAILAYSEQRGSGYLWGSAHIMLRGWRLPRYGAMMRQCRCCQMERGTSTR